MSFLSSNFNNKSIGTMSFILLLFVMLSCSGAELPDKENNNFFTAEYDLNRMEVSALFDEPLEMGLIVSTEIDEASGVVVSRQNPQVLWTHNDSGDSNRIFLLRNDGTHLGTFMLSGAENRDWEDIAMGPGPIDDLDYIYVAEIGDNLAQYPIKYIYRFPEPGLPNANAGLFFEIKDVEKISFVFPDNERKDAEALMVDPWTKDLYIVTKREYPVTVYRLPFPHSTSDTLIAEKYGTLPLPYVTAGDISADGTEIIIKNYEKVFLWSRQEGESMADALVRPPVRVPYTPEPQGEAIAFPEDRSGYYTLSEVRDQVIPRIYFYRRKN